MVISNKYGIYELPHELPDDLRLTILGNQEISGMSQNFIGLEPSAQSYSQNGNFVNTSKSLLKTNVCLQYFVNGCLCKEF